MADKFRLMVVLTILVAGAWSLAAAQTNSGRVPKRQPPKLSSAPVDRILGTLPDDAVVAVVDGQPIKLSEVDAFSRNQDPRKLFEMNQQLHELRETALKELVGERLLAAAAAKHGLTVEGLLDRAIPTPSVTETEILEVFNSGRSKNPMDFESSKPLIVRFLQDKKRKDARAKFVEHLKQEAKKTGKPVVMSLEPPRVHVAVSANDPARGAGQVEIIEFSDFQCPYCQQAEPVIKDLLARYDGKVRLVWKDAPLPNHPNAVPAAIAARCAGDQGKFWEYHDTLFANQKALDNASLKRHAGTAGLDLAVFEQCIASGKHAAALVASLQELVRLPVSVTPTFLINGRLVKGAVPLETLAAVIDEELRQPVN
jgi:protein-disulfide isomerase